MFSASASHPSRWIMVDPDIFIYRHFVLLTLYQDIVTNRVLALLIARYRSRFISIETR